MRKLISKFTPFCWTQKVGNVGEHEKTKVNLEREQNSGNCEGEKHG
jgi:hypothetical protein